MGPRLNCHVTSGLASYGPGDDVPAEVVAAFAGQDVWEGPPDTPDPQTVGEAPGGAVQAPQQPPTSGKGSGLDSWRDYATSLGITVPDDATRDDIIAAVTGQD